MKGYYDKISKGYDELYGEEQLNKWKQSKKLIKFSKKDTVLDLGCGTGLLTVKLAKYVNFVVGLDYSKGMLSRAPKKSNILYVAGNAERMPFEDKEFDKVVSFTLIQDIRNWKNVFEEIKRVTKGDILLTVLKRGKKLEKIKERLSRYFKVKKFIEEDKDFIFLLN